MELCESCKSERSENSPSPRDSKHDDIIKWKHFPRYWPFVRGIHRSPVNSPHKGQWRGALMFSFICAWINRWVNNREAGDLRRYRAHYIVIVMNNRQRNSYGIFIWRDDENWPLSAMNVSLWNIKWTIAFSVFGFVCELMGAGDAYYIYIYIYVYIYIYIYIYLYIYMHSTIIGSGNSLSPFRHQAIMWTMQWGHIIDWAIRN